jgi:hypothetical protein
MAFLDFLRPKWRGSNINVREAAVAKLTDQALLAQIAQTDSSGVVRDTAVEKLEDQALLAQVAKTDSDAEVRVRAVTRLTDQALLAQVAKTANDAEVRRLALINLTDQAVLAQVAGTDTDAGMRRAAVAILTDQAALAQVAKTDSDAGVRRAAVEKLTDHVAISEILKTDRDSEVRKRAALKPEPLAAAGVIPAREALRAAGHFVIMASGHYQGCKLVASIDASSHEVCALEVEFKNATPSALLANRALAAWRAVLASRSYVVPDSLVSRGWNSNKSPGASYPIMALFSPGHDVDRCCGGSLRWDEF